MSIRLASYTILVRSYPRSTLAGANFSSPRWRQSTAFREFGGPNEATLAASVALTKSFDDGEGLLHDHHERGFSAGNPALARSIRNRFPYLVRSNHLQVELLKRYRAGDSAQKVHRGIHLTINGLAAGLRNSRATVRIQITFSNLIKSDLIRLEKVI